MVGILYLMLFLIACSAGLIWSTKELRLALSVRSKQICGSIDSFVIEHRDLGDNTGCIVNVTYSYNYADKLNHSSKVSFFDEKHLYTTRQVKRIEKAISDERIYLIDTSKGEGTSRPAIITSVLICDPWFHLSRLTIWLSICWVALLISAIIVSVFGTQPGTGNVDIPFKG